MVLNPVRAKTIKYPRLYPWSSYGATAGKPKLILVIRPTKS